jgi:DNA (cytosine-5)-methyltransferase 1
MIKYTNRGDFSNKVTDVFCGAGGSGCGMYAAGGELYLAINHWDVALRTHARNFTQTKHVNADVSQTNPRQFRRTPIAWFSPECTNHSLAAGKKRTNIGEEDLFGDIENPEDPRAARSRATMFDVIRFAEVHEYELIIVENVIDIMRWKPLKGWLLSMDALGYNHKFVFLNSSFAHPTRSAERQAEIQMPWAAPQSRDRVYVCFWRKGNKAPDLDIRPWAWCEKCNQNVQAVQSWKKIEKQWGVYGRRNSNKGQYKYCCPRCAQVVEPYAYAAMNAIDWSLQIHTIGARQNREYRRKYGLREIGDATRERVKYGLRKYAARPYLVDHVHSGIPSSMTSDLTVDPLRTLLTRKTHYVALPFVTTTSHGGSTSPNRSTGPDQPLATITTMEGEKSVVMPFMTTSSHAGNRATGADEPMPTVTTAREQTVIMPGFLAELYGTGTASDLADPIGTQMTVRHQGLVTMPFMINTHHDTNRATGPADPLNTVITDGMESIVLPNAFVAAQYGGSNVTAHGSEPMPTLTTLDRHALITNPLAMAFLLGNYTRDEGKGAVSSVHETWPTIPTFPRHHYLCTPEEVLDWEPTEADVDACGYRGLKAHEVQAGMGFPDWYQVEGDEDLKIHQLGNAVTPSAAEVLFTRMIATLM